MSSFSFTRLATVHEISIKCHLAGHGVGCYYVTSCLLQLVSVLIQVHNVSNYITNYL